MCTCGFANELSLSNRDIESLQDISKKQYTNNSNFVSEHTVKIDEKNINFKNNSSLVEKSLLKAYSQGTISNISKGTPNE